jgi:WD40 repeat protein/serine/threonine protein kinase
MRSCPPEDVLVGLVESGLPINDEAAVRRHVEGCARCRPALVAVVRGRRAAAEPDFAGPLEVNPDWYRIEEELARGGMGVVLRARDRRLGRPVALKQVSRQDPWTQRRLQREALITARLQHPSIVPVYEVGRWPNGQDFYAMKLVSGRSLADVIEQTRSLEDRLILVPHVIAVAEAIAYAHSEGVIHRDLKPANIVLGPFGETVIIDWGLAKAIDEADPTSDPDARDGGALTEALTANGAVLGTPAYMPPEQARGVALDERADVYAIGTILYHLLAGAPPFRGTSQDILLRLLVTAPPPIEERQPGVPADLAAIVRKAMAREPSERYPSAGELARDLQRFQAGRLVGARRYSRRQLVSRWIGRHRRAVLAATALLALLVATIWISVDQIRHSRDDAAARRDELILVQARAALAHDPTEAAAWLKTYPSAGAQQDRARLLGVDAASRGLARAIHRLVVVPGSNVRFSPSGRYLAGGGRLWDFARGDVRVLAEGDAAAWMDVLFTPDSLLVGAVDQPVRSWNLTTFAQHRIGGEDRGGAAAGFDLSRDAKTLATVSEDGVVHLWELAGGAERRLGVTSSEVSHVEFSPDGAWLAIVSGSSGTAEMWEVGGGGRRVVSAGTAKVAAFAWLPDSRRVVTSSEDGKLRLTEVGGPSRELVGHDQHARTIDVSPDGSLVTAGWHDGRISITRIADGQTQWIHGHVQSVDSVVFAPDGALLASGGQDRTVRVWDVASGGSRSLLGHDDAVKQVLFSPDGETIVSISRDGTMRTWPAHDGSRLVPAPFASYTSAWVSRDKRWFAAGTSLGRVYLHDLANHGVRVLGSHRHHVGPMEFSSDSRWLVSGGADGDVWLWDVARGTGEQLGDVGAEAIGIAVSPDGATVAAAGAAGGTLAVWTTSDRRERFRSPLAGGVGALAFHPGGHTLAVGTRGGELALWDVASGAPRVLSRSGPIGALAFAPDGRWLASAELASIRITDLSTGTSRLLRGHTRPVRVLQVSSDGSRLASLDVDSSIWLWDPRTAMGRRLGGDDTRFRDTLAFSAGGTRLASISTEGTIWLWDTSLGVVRRILPGVERPFEIFFSGDDRYLTSFSEHGLRTWAMDPTREVPEGGQTAGWLEAQTTARVSLEDRVE